MCSHSFDQVLNDHPGCKVCQLVTLPSSKTDASSLLFYIHLIFQLCSQKYEYLDPETGAISDIQLDFGRMPTSSVDIWILPADSLSLGNLINKAETIL